MKDAESKSQCTRLQSFGISCMHFCRCFPMFQSSWRLTSSGQKQFTLESSEMLVNSYRIHGMTSQNIIYLIFTTMTTSNLTQSIRVINPAKRIFVTEDICWYARNQRVQSVRSFFKTVRVKRYCQSKNQDRIQDIIQAKIFVFVMLLKQICIYCLLFVVNLFHMAKKVFRFYNYNFILFGYMRKLMHH